MKVTKEMLHPDLQGHYASMQMTTYFFKYKWSVKLLRMITDFQSKGKNIEGLDCDEIFVPSGRGDYSIRTRIYRPKDHQGPLPAMLYIHGGGYVFGNPELFGHLIEKFIQTRPCVVIAPDYRKAFTKPYPAALDDCYDTLLWMKANAAQLGISEDNYIVGGHSGGGGLTAAVTLKARDMQEVKIAFQMPFYPMLDYTQPDDPAREIQSPAWDTRANRTGWNAYLSDLRKEGKKIPAYASPAKNSDYSNFPPTITFVGTLEPFYWETERYVEQLKSAGIDVAFEVYKGCFHSFENVAAETNIGKEALDFSYRSYAEFYDKYLP